MNFEGRKFDWFLKSLYLPLLHFSTKSNIPTVWDQYYWCKVGWAHPTQHTFTAEPCSIWHTVGHWQSGATLPLGCKWGRGEEISLLGSLKCSDVLPFQRSELRPGKETLWKDAPVLLDILFSQTWDPLRQYHSAQMEEYCAEREWHNIQHTLWFECFTCFFYSNQGKFHCKFHNRNASVSGFLTPTVCGFRTKE